MWSPVKCVCVEPIMYTEHISCVCIGLYYIRIWENYKLGTELNGRLKLN